MPALVRDAAANLAVSSIAVPPSPAKTGGTLTLTEANLPVPPYNATVAPAGALPTRANSEIIRVTAASVDGLELTFERVAEAGSGPARTIVAGDRIFAGFTVKTIEDLWDAIEAAEVAAATSLSEALINAGATPFINLNQFVNKNGEQRGVKANAKSKCAVTKGSKQVTGIEDPSRFRVGNVVSGKGSAIPVGTTITAIEPVKKELTLSLVASATNGAEVITVDAQRDMQDALTLAEVAAGGKANTAGVPKALVGAIEPGEYFWESTTATTEAPNGGNGIKLAGFRAAIWLPPGVAITGSSLTSTIFVLGPKVIEKREANPAELCAFVVKEKGGGQAAPGLSKLTLSCSNLVNEGGFRSTPAPRPDGYVPCSGGKVAEDITITGGFRYHAVVGGDHQSWWNVALSEGWAHIGHPTYVKDSGDIVWMHPRLTGGYHNFYSESGDTSLPGWTIVGGWGAWSKGPVWGRPSAGAKASWLSGIRLISHAMEGGNRGMFDNPAEDSMISRLKFRDCKIGGTDPPLAKAGESDASVLPLYFWRADIISEIDVTGTIIAAAGWGKGAAAIRARTRIENCSLGDVTEALNECIYRSQQFISSPEIINVQAVCTEQATGAKMLIRFFNAASAVKRGDLLRRVPSGAANRKNTFAVQPYDKNEGVEEGVALQSVAAGECVPVAVRVLEQTTQVYARLMRGVGNGSVITSIYPAQARGGTSTLAADFLFGTASGAGHYAPTTLYGCKGAQSSLKVDGLSDHVTGGGTVSVQGKVVTYRELIAKGTTTVFNATLTQKNNVLTSLSAVAGLAEGMRLTGTGLAPNTEITFIDKENGVIRINNNTLGSGEGGSGVQSLTAVAPVDLFEGVLIGSTTRSKTTFTAKTMTGTQNLAVQDSSGFPEAGGYFEMAQGQQKFTFTYTHSNHATNTLEGVKLVSGSGAVEILAGTQVIPPSLKAIGIHAKVYRAMQVASAGLGSAREPAALLNEAGEHSYKTGESLAGIKISAPLAGFPAKGMAKLQAVTTIPSSITFDTTMTTVEVTSLESLPTAGTGDINQVTISWTGKEEKSGKKLLTGCVVKTTKHHGPQSAGALLVVRGGAELVFTSSTGTEIKGVTVLNGSAFPVGKSAALIVYTFAPEGGVIKHGSELIGYQGAMVIKGKSYIFGIATAGGGGEIKSGQTVEDQPVIPFEGSGYPSGVNGAIVIKGGGSIATFTYEDAIVVTAEAAVEGGTEEEETEPGEGEETGEEGEAVAAHAGGYFVNPSNMEITGGGSQVKGRVVAMPTLTATLKPNASPATASVSALVEQIPPSGKVRVGDWEATYSSRNGTELKGLVWTAGASATTFPVGQPVSIVPGSVAKADSTLRAAYATGNETEAAKGCVAVGGSGPRIGLAVEDDEVAYVLAQL